MSKLTKPQLKLHTQAEALLQGDARLGDADREFIYRNWLPTATHNVTWAAAFFTPYDLATDVASLTGSVKGRVLDACAGIGTLAHALHRWNSYESRITELVCVEINPGFVEVGRRLLPEARWERGDVFNQPFMESLGLFDVGLSNPPYGRPSSVDRATCAWLQFRGEAQLMVAEVLLRRCRQGANMIIPAQDCNYPGYYEENGTQGHASSHYEKWHALFPEAHISPLAISTRHYATQWVGASPRVLAVSCDCDPANIYLEAESPTTLPAPTVAAPGTGWREQLELITT